MTYWTSNPLIRTKITLHLYLCWQLNKPLYKNLRDSQFSVLGTWQLAKCFERRSGLIWIDTTSLAKDIGSACENYCTRNNQLIEEITCILKHTYHAIKRNYLFSRYKYHEMSKFGLLSLLDGVLNLIPRWSRGVDSKVRYLQVRPGRVLLNILEQFRFEVRPDVGKCLDVRPSKP